MTSINKELLEAALTGAHDGFEHRLQWHLSLTTVKDRPKTHLFFISFGGDKRPNLPDLIEFLYYKIVQFCIPPKMRSDARELSYKEKNERHTQELTDLAIKLFLKATDEKVRTGEPGELLLYTILEWYFKAPQLVCKMFLKTSRNMPVHGTDGIHLSLDGDKRTLNFMWGESKIFKDVGDAVDAAIESINTLITNTECPISRDIEILKDHSHVEDPDLKEAILKYLDYSTEEANNKRHSFVAMIGFEYEKLATCKTKEDQDAFLASYVEEASKAAEKFYKKAEAKNLLNYEFMFILVPFASVETFRRDFLRRLGRDTN